MASGSLMCNFVSCLVRSHAYLICRNVYAIGDCASLENNPLPPTAEIASQHVSKCNMVYLTGGACRVSTWHVTSTHWSPSRTHGSSPCKLELCKLTICSKIHPLTICY